MNNNATTAAPATTAAKLEDALSRATEPLTQTQLAEAAGVARSTATTWLGQQVAKGLAERIDRVRLPSLFHVAGRHTTPATEAAQEALTAAVAAADAEALAQDEAAEATMRADADTIDLGTEEEDPAVAAFVAALDTVDTAAGAAAAMAALIGDPTEERIEADRRAAVEEDDIEAVIEADRREACEEAGIPTAPTCKCGDETVGHVHTKKERATRTGTRGASKDAAWAVAEQALRAAGPGGLPVPEVWAALEGAGLAHSGAYALVNRKRDAGVLTTAAEAPRLAERRYALAAL